MASHDQDSVDAEIHYADENAIYHSPAATVLLSLQETCVEACDTLVLSVPQTAENAEIAADTVVLSLDDKYNQKDAKLVQSKRGRLNVQERVRHRVIVSQDTVEQHFEASQIQCTKFVPSKRLREECEKKITYCCKPHRLHELFGHDFTDAQKTAVRELGFGGLLEIHLTKMDATILSWLISNYNHDSQKLHISKNLEYTITDADVFDLFCLPWNKGNQIRLDVEKFDKKLEMMSEFKNRYGVLNKDGKREVSTNTLLAEMRKLTSGGEEFKRLFVIYAVSTVLDPTHNRSADLKLLHVLNDISMIGRYDWCSYVLERLNIALKRLNKNRIASKKGKNEYVGGCLLILLVSYFHRLKLKGKSMSTDLPLIQHWDDEKMLKRVHEDNGVMGFGDGELEKDSMYPVCVCQIHKVSEAIANLGVANVSLHLGEDRAVPFIIPSIMEGDHQTTEPRQVKYDIRDVVHSILHETREGERYITFKLPEHLPSNEEIHSVAKDEFQATSMLFKRDMDVLSTHYMDVFSVLKDKYFPSNNNPRQKSVSPMSEDFFNNEKVLEYIDGLVANAISVKEVSKCVRTNDVPSIVSNSEEEDLFHPIDGLGGDGLVKYGNSGEPSTVLKATDTNEEFFSTATGEIRGEENEMEICDATSTHRSTFELSELWFKTMAESSYGSDNDLQGSVFSSKLRRTKACDGSGCSLVDLGRPGVCVKYISKFMNENKDKVRDMLRMRQEVADYCFVDSDCDSFPTNEFLVCFGTSISIPRDEFLSLADCSDVIGSSIVDGWCLLMNFVETNKEHSPKRVFFGLSHMDPLLDLLNCDSDPKKKRSARALVMKAWSNWIASGCCNINISEASMIFLPVLHEVDFSLIVINLLIGKVQYLNHVELSDWSFYEGLCNRVCKEMSYFLKKHGHPKAADVAQYEPVLVQLKWKVKEMAKSQDSAVYAMMHMLTFEGSSSYSLDLRRLPKRKYYRAEICASLVLADINERREEVLHKVREFSLKKWNKGEAKKSLKKWNKGEAKKF